MIIIAPLVLKAIVDAAEAAYPAEACGLLSGRDDGGRVLVSAFHPSRNLAADPSRGFEIDPALRLSLQRDLRGTGGAVVGLFHSHPDSAAEPSALDRQRAWEPGLVWLITAVWGGQAIWTTAQRFEGEGGFIPLSLAMALRSM